MLKLVGQEWRPVLGSDLGINGRVAPLNAIDMKKDGDVWSGWVVGDDAEFDNIKAIILEWQGTRWRVWTGSNNIAKHLYDVRVVSAAEAWAVGQDGSESWYDAREGPGGWPRLGHSGVDTLFAVDLADPLFGWDGGAAGRMNHYQGSCHDDTVATQCWSDNHARPIKNENGQPLNLDVEDLDLLSRTSGWLVGAPQARESLVAALDGEEWRVVSVEGDPGVRLRALHMVHPGRGYAVGDDGVILAYSDPSIPTPSAPAPSPEITHTPTASDTPETSPTGTPASETPTATVDPETGTPSPTGSATGTATDEAPTPTHTRTATFTPTATATRTATAEPPNTLWLPLAVTNARSGHLERWPRLAYSVTGLTRHPAVPTLDGARRDSPIAPQPN
jgi:hypothetical protein